MVTHVRAGGGAGNGHRGAERNAGIGWIAAAAAIIDAPTICADRHLFDATIGIVLL